MNRNEGFTLWQNGHGHHTLKYAAAEQFRICERYALMRILTDRSHTVEIVPCSGPLPSYRWVIRRSDGTPLRQSPYAFATEKGALISASCWCRELSETDRALA